MRKFKTFESMMKSQGGIKPSDVKYPKKNNDFEEVGEYLAVSAHYKSVDMAQEWARKNGLFIVTETIEDGEEDNETFFGYVRGLAFVNRERYFFTRKNDDFCFCETVKF